MANLSIIIINVFCDLRSNFKMANTSSTKKIVNHSEVFAEPCQYLRLRVLEK